MYGILSAQPHLEHFWCIAKQPQLGVKVEVGLNPENDHPDLGFKHLHTGSTSLPLPLPGPGLEQGIPPNQ